MVAVTPDGRHAVVVASSKTQDVNETKVLLVDLETRRIVRATPVEPSGQPFAGARNNTVAPDGRTVGIGGTLGDVMVVDAVSSEVSPLLHAHDGFVESVTFAPDYATFVTTGQDGVVALWDAATQKFLGSVLPLGPSRRVRASFVAADRVLIVYDTGEIFEWDPRPDSWENYACKVAGRNLEQAEWAELFPGEPYRVTCPDFSPGA
jgi:WD40 repeat protein